MSVASADYLQMVADKGRFGDTVLGHLTPGEMVIPKPVLENNPHLVKAVAKAIADMGANPARYVVGSHQNSYNPHTGQGEYGLGSFFKAVTSPVRAVVKEIGNAVQSVAKAAVSITADALTAVGVDEKTANQLAQIAVAVGAAYLGGVYMAPALGVSATTGAAIGAGMNGYGQTGSVSAGISAGLMTYGTSALMNTGAEAGSQLSNAPSTTPSDPSLPLNSPDRVATWDGTGVADRLSNYGVENAGTLSGTSAKVSADALMAVDNASTYLNSNYLIDPVATGNAAGTVLPGMTYAGAIGAAYGAGTVGNEIGKAQNAYADYLKEQEDMAKKAREFAMNDFSQTGNVAGSATSALPVIESISQYYSGGTTGGVNYNSNSGSSTGTAGTNGVKYLQATNTGNGVKYTETSAPTEEENRKNQWNNVVYV